MQIIVVSDRYAQARTLTVSARHVIGAGLVILGLAALTGTGLSYALLKATPTPLAEMPLVKQLVAQANERAGERHDAFVRENISALAVKLGEMQAQLMRLDSLGERLMTLGGVKPKDLKFNETPGRGGTAVSPFARSLSLEELHREIESMSTRLDHRSDHLRILEEDIVRERARSTLLPSATPVDAPYTVSGFGWRIDPFTGRSAMHEGIDFAARPGTPILAAAAGLVIVAEQHPAYGNMIEIDHGNGLSTRYAHASRLLSKVGEVVKRGQKIAEVGSTGHSTGPHLHFEVRQDGVAQNPRKFLSMAAAK